VTPTAWYGRAAHSDSAIDQLRRQHYGCARLLPDGQPYAGCYFDIGVGYRDADQRDRRLDPATVAAIGLPYSGGMAQLLHNANDPTRRFQRVVCFELDRVSRNAHVLAYIIDQLIAADVDLLVPSMTGLATQAGHSPAQRFAATVALLTLQADHAQRHTRRLGHARTSAQDQEGRR